MFKIGTNGTGYSVLRQFTASDPSFPGYGELLVSGQTVYGTTYGVVPTYNNGTVFKINTDGSGYTVLKRFTETNGASWPAGSLVLSGTTLYGTTQCGGSLGHGRAYAIQTNGSGYVELHGFLTPTGDFPYAGLTLSDSVLYGTTLDSPQCGTVFKLNCNGTGYTVLRDMSASDGGIPWGGLTIRGTTLFGTTYGVYKAAPTNVGTVFMMNTDGSGFVVLKRFNGADGANPASSLLLSGMTLYGTTDYGGPADCGVLFSLSLPAGPPTILTAPASQTVGAGQVALFSVSADGALPRFYQWFKDGLGLNDGGNLSGAHTDTLTLNNVTGGIAGGYSVIVSNSYGSVTSSVATLTVEDPVINTQPTNQSVTAGQIVEFSVNADGTPSLGYQWFKDGVGLK